MRHRLHKDGLTRRQGQQDPRGEQDEQKHRDDNVEVHLYTMCDNSSRSSTNHCALPVLILQYTHDIVDVLAKNAWLILAITFDDLRIEKVGFIILDHVVNPE